MNLCVFRVIAFTAVLTSTAAAGTSKDLMWGANGHPLTAYAGVAYGDQLNLLTELGMTSYRVDVTRRDQAEALETLLSEAKARKIDILPILVPPVDLAKMSPEQLYRVAYDFAAFFVGRFKLEVRVWELSNELENYAIINPCEMQDDGKQYPCQWGPAGGVDPIEYYGPRWQKVSAVLKGLADATTDEDPTIRKAIGTAGWGHVGAFERMRRDGIRWDISVWHTYDENLEWGLKRVAAFGKPIWVTEFNSPKGSQKGVVIQARGLSKMIQELRRLAQVYHVEAAHVYELLDETYWAPDFEAFMGVAYLTKASAGGWAIDGEKPAYCVARSLIRNERTTAERTGVSDVVQPVSGQASPRSCDLCLFDTRDASAENVLSYASCLTLGHAADSAAISDWAANLKSGAVGVTDVLTSMVETRVKIQSEEQGALSDGQFVIFLYRVLLNRGPDGQGLADYVRALERGETSRALLVRGIIGSDEFKQQRRLLFMTQQ